jgi:PAS domain-containing protein
LYLLVTARNNVVGNFSRSMESMARARECEHAEEAARIEQALFKRILEIAEDAIISVGSDQRILLFNRGAEKVFGYSPHEVIGEPQARMRLFVGERPQVRVSVEG